MMTTRDTLGARVLKHGLCAITVALLATAAVSMAGKVFERSVATVVFHNQGVSGIAFE